MLFTVYIMKNGKYIGAFNDDTKIDFFDLLSYTSNILRNYNRNLISKSLPDLVLAHRMLELEGVSLNNSGHIRILDDSLEHIEGFYSSYEWPETNEDDLSHGMIGLYGSDIVNLIACPKIRVGIDIENKTIFLRSFVRKETSEEYCKRKDLRRDLFHSSSLPEYYIEKFSFNELEDIIDAISSSKVWREKRTGLICSLNNSLL